MNVIVFGGTNFIGRAIADKLTETHHVTVVNRGSRLHWRDDIAHVTADRTDTDAMKNLITGNDFDAIVDVSATEPNLMTQVLEHVADHVSTYVLLSSASVYTESAPHHEDDPVGGGAAWAEYGTAKYDCEQALLTAAVPIDKYILRPPYIYGPDNNEDREAWIWARLLNHKPIWVPGEGTNRIQFAYIDDLANIISEAVARQLPPSTYNVATATTYSFIDWITALASVAGTDPEFRHVDTPQPPARSYFPFRAIDLTLNTTRIATSATTRFTDFADGAARTLAALSDHEPDRLRYVPNEQESVWLSDHD